MKRKILAFLGAVLLLSGCTTEIDYSKVTVETEETEDVVDNKEIGQETVIIPELMANDLYSPSKPVVAEEEYSEVYQPEFNTDAQSYTDGLSGFNGSGFICLGNKAYATLDIKVPSSQHYNIGIRLCSAGTAVAVITGGEKEIDSPEGDYKTIDGTVQGAVYSDESTEFSYVYLNGIYLSKGENKLTLQALSGTAYIDEVSVENAPTVTKLAYEISNSCINKNANDTTKAVKKYLADIYGNRVLTGQYCSTGTNTEINAIYMETGRYSALRCGDLGVFTEYYNGSDKNNEDEIQTAINWWKNGGLISYSWYWYAPDPENPHYSSAITDFDLSDALCDSSIAVLSPTSLEAYSQTGRVSSEAVRLIADMDVVAEKLKLLEAQDVTVLFRPLPEAGNGWYWWGKDSENYLWLYKFIYERFTEYHQLGNIIWVWDGESYDFYPGDDYVDIVGMDLYTRSDISGNSRMLDAVSYTIKSKAAALTECGRIPNPDYIVRDNAYWLWFALWKGDYIINSDGSISYERVTPEELDYAYNNELYITLDELPDFSRY